MEHDTHGVQYFVDEPECQPRCCPTMLSSSYYLEPAAGQSKKSFILLATAKMSMSSYILYISKLKRWKATGRKC